MTAQPLFDIDYAKIRQLLIKAAISGANNAALFTMDRAKEYAPVRRVFAQSGHRRRVELMKPLEHRRAQQIYTRAFGSPSRMQLARASTVARLKGAGVHPMHGKYISGKEYGLARTVSHTDRSNRNVPVFKLGKGQYHEGSREVAGSQLADSTSQANLSSRGKYELRTGRAIHTVGAKEVLGGRLRKSIRMIPAEAIGNHVWAYVVAGDNEEVDYAIYQEVGTVHNAAHPFMRPALRDGRRVLVEQVGRAAAQIQRQPRQYGKPTGQANLVQRHSTNPQAAGVSSSDADKAANKARLLQSEEAAVAGGQAAEVKMPYWLSRLGG